MGVPGLSIVVRDKNGIIFNQSYGVQDQDSGIPLKDSKPILPIGSQSKTFTAVALMQLIADGHTHPVTGRKLSLQDPITELLPNLGKPEWLNGVTLADALAHRTRFGNGDYNKEWGDNPPSTDMLRNDIRMSDIEPSKTPGYSNRMYDMLGVVVEDTSGMKFNDYIQRQIVERHKLGEIYPSYNAIPEADRARVPTGYDGPNLDRKVGLSDWRGTAASGGFYGSPSAITNFYHKLAHGRILPDHKVDTNNETGMFQKITKGGGWLGYGIQMRSMEPNDNYNKKNPYHVPLGQGLLYGHTGGVPGYQSDTRYNPQTGLTVSVFSTALYTPGLTSDPKMEAVIEQRMKEHAERTGLPIVMSEVFKQLGTTEPSPLHAPVKNEKQSVPLPDK